MRYQWYGNNIHWYKCLKNALLEEFTADHQVPGLIGFTADYII